MHLVRNTLRYVSKKYWAQITREMREIYTAPSLPAAEARFAEFAEQWREKYPAMIGSWETAGNEFVPFLEFPPELRKVVYTTDDIVKCSRRVSVVSSGRLRPRRRVRHVRRSASRGRVAL